MAGISRLDRERFERALAEASCNASEGAFDRLVERHGEPGRSYHTDVHVAACLGLFDEFRHLAIRPAEVEIALWYHDAVYDPRGRDNEERSAAMARAELRALDPEAERRIEAMILATRHGVPVRGIDQALVVDIDLSVLGGTPEEFARYDLRIREEYAWVPRDAYRVGRSTVLRGFLDRGRIFILPEFHRRFESRARANLGAALAELLDDGAI